MILFQNRSNTPEAGPLVALFGAGLIGGAMARSLLGQGEWRARPLPFAWLDADRARADADRLLEALQAAARPLARQGAPAFSFAWCAGRAGFAATQAQVAQELASFDRVLDLARRLASDWPDSTVDCHHVSSLGGLFERQTLVDGASRPRPLRRYGRLKLAQEERLESLPAHVGRCIYRPVSVYGVAGRGQRRGLIATLLANGIRNRSSTIIGGPGTLRDYVLNEDVGAFLARRVREPLAAGARRTCLLASGKPTSIFEIQRLVEGVIRRPIYLQYRLDEEASNAADITINPASLPQDWVPTDLAVGIRQVSEGMGVAGRARHAAGGFARTDAAHG